MNLGDKKYYLNKQLSWLEFNKRVLEEAQDPKTPLLERFKFLSIVSSNLDEFVMVRVSRVRKDVLNGKTKTDKSGIKPRELMNLLSKKIHLMVKKQYEIYNFLVDEIEKQDIKFIKYNNLEMNQKRFLENYFEDIIKPSLTPMAIDESRPFPLIFNKSLNIGVSLSSKKDSHILPNKEGDKLFSIVRVPANIDRLIRLKGKDHYIFLEDIIINNLESIFPGYEVNSADMFRMTRNAEVNLNEDTHNLLKEMEKYVKRRKWGDPVRLEINKDINPNFKNFLVKSLKLKEDDIYILDGPIDLVPIFDIGLLKGHEDLKYKKLFSRPARDFIDDEDIFETIKTRDRLVHHPFESFDPVIDFIKKAAKDPKVLAIKQTLYRVSGDSPIIKELAKASDNGKQVTVLVELKARFDEKNNIEWAKTLEAAGCHVVYGLTGLKVHSKLILVIREEEEGIRRYVHMASGNYNDKTAKFYTDIGMFTAKETFGKDISSLFNMLTGYSSSPVWKKLVVSPINLRTKMLGYLDNEIKNVKSGVNGRVIIKCNSLIDKTLIKKLYEASQVGVKIDLIVRGICCLRPGLEGISDNIRVISIVGRLLEHSRIFYFENNGDPVIYGASADWRPRNLDRRVEIAFPIESNIIKTRISSTLDLILRDNVKSRKLNHNGSYTRVESSKEPINSQLELYKKVDVELNKLRSKKDKFMVKSLFNIFSRKQ